MSIAIQCSHCQASYRVPEGSLGKQAKCLKCGERFTVAKMTSAELTKTAGSAPLGMAARTAAATARDNPAPKSPNRSQRVPVTEKVLLAAFHGSMSPSKRSWAYRVAIVLVALTVAILPLLYVALIALTGFGMYYHLVNNTFLFEMGYGRVRLLFASLYFAPIVTGAIAIPFLLKPLFARPSRRERFRSLTRNAEPLLFTYVDRICDEVGAPRPKRIDVDCQVNASAGFRRGFLSMLGSDLVLTIGLPLAAGLTVREFGGVLAHELGHFSQGMGMRLSYLIRSVIDWFARVVYQRDEWDDWLEQAVHGLDFRIAWMFLVAQLFVLVGRGVLWLLLHVGLLISGLLLRQMEFDADSYETQFAGSAAFANTVRKLHLLSGAAQLADMQLSASLDRRELVDNLPALIVHHASQMAKVALPDIEKQIEATRTGWFDSHPCDRERIAAAERIASQGTFRLDRPAKDLFNNFRAQAEATTWDLYCGIFGPKVPRSALRPVQEFVAAYRG